MHLRRIQSAYIAGVDIWGTYIDTYETLNEPIKSNTMSNGKSDAWYSIKTP